MLKYSLENQGGKYTDAYYKILTFFCAFEYFHDGLFYLFFKGVSEWWYWNKKSLKVTQKI